jgi:hypothetical protein
MGVMILDTVLGPDDGDALQSELRTLGRPRVLTGAGATTQGGKTHQFRFRVDEPGGAWAIAYDDGSSFTHAEGIRTYRPSRRARDVDLERSPVRDPAHGQPPELQLLHPSAAFWWGTGPGKFRPVVAQRVGRRSIVITFEHNEDAVFRKTIAIDENTGIGHRMMSFDEAIAITEINEPGDPSEDLGRRFTKLTGPIPADY